MSLQSSVSDAINLIENATTSDVEKDAEVVFSVVNSLSNVGLVQMSDLLLRALFAYATQRSERTLALEANILFNTAVSYANSERAMEAIPLLDNLLELTERNFEEMSRLVPQILIRKGSAFNSIGDYDNAIQSLEAAVSISEEQGNREAAAHARNNLGLAFLNVGKMEFAKNHLEKAFALRKEVLGPTHLDTFATEINIISIEYAQSSKEKALASMIDLSDRLLKASDSREFELANAYSLVAQWSFTGSDLHLALEYYSHELRVLNDIGSGVPERRQRTKAMVDLIEAALNGEETALARVTEIRSLMHRA